MKLKMRVRTMNLSPRNESIFGWLQRRILWKDEWVGTYERGWPCYWYGCRCHSYYQDTILSFPSLRCWAWESIDIRWLLSKWYIRPSNWFGCRYRSYNQDIILSFPSLKCRAWESIDTRWLLSKWYITPSKSPWESQLLFTRRKMDR